MTVTPMAQVSATNFPEQQQPCCEHHNPPDDIFVGEKIQKEIWFKALRSLDMGPCSLRNKSELYPNEKNNDIGRAPNLEHQC